MNRRKLTEKEVLEIERKYREDDLTYRQIAKRHNVAKTTVEVICKHKIWKRLWSWPPYKKVKENENEHEWSRRHYGLLITCADIVMRRFRSDCVLDRYDLISWGWLQCLRHRKENELTGCGKFTILTMMEYAWFFKTGMHKESKRRFDNITPEQLATELSDSWRLDYYRDPYKLMEEKELWENVRKTKWWKKRESDRNRMQRKRDSIKRKAKK